MKSAHRIILLLWFMGACQVCVGSDVPSFVLDVPAGHFAGIGSPCGSIQESRQSAISDVARQVLGCIGISYDYHSSYSAQGSPRNPEISFDDGLISNSHGIVVGIEKRIVKSEYSTENGRHICFILVHYPDSEIDRMRRLSAGSDISVDVSLDDGKLLVSANSSNPVKFTYADIHLVRENRFADTISYFVMKVSKGSSENYRVGFDGNRIVFIIPSGDYLFGCKVSGRVVVHGVDEIGRSVSEVGGF